MSPKNVKIDAAIGGLDGSRIALFKVHIRGDDGLALITDVDHDDLLSLIQASLDGSVYSIKICNDSDGRPWTSRLPVLARNGGLVDDLSQTRSERVTSTGGGDPLRFCPWFMVALCACQPIDQQAPIDCPGAL